MKHPLKRDQRKFYRFMMLDLLIDLDQINQHEILRRYMDKCVKMLAMNVSYKKLQTHRHID